jgi:hypothetical protein
LTAPASATPRLPAPPTPPPELPRRSFLARDPITFLGPDCFF